jgi:hypothetical protein
MCAWALTVTHMGAPCVEWQKGTPPPISGTDSTQGYAESRTKSKKPRGDTPPKIWLEGTGIPGVLSEYSTLQHVPSLKCTVHTKDV